MSFKLKVVIINIMLISIFFGVIGYFLMDNSYNISLNAQIRTAMEGNQLLKANVEAQVINMVLNEDFTSLNTVAEMGNDIANNMQGTGALFYFLNTEREVIYSNFDNPIVDDKILDYLEIDKKQYVIRKDGRGYYIYVASIVKAKDQTLYIVNVDELTDVYEQNRLQRTYYQILIVAALIICCVALFITTHILTKPIDKLNKQAAKIADGDYSSKTNIYTNDEIGELSKKFDIMAEAVEDRVKELTDAARQREDFVANFTHEVKTPLTAIIGYADMLRSKELNREDRFMAANYIFGEGKRLENMSMKLFDILLLGRHEIEEKDINTLSIAENIKISVTPMLEKANIILSTDIEESIISGDRELLKTVFVNIIDNARKASKEGSTIKMVGYIEGNMYRFNIIDKGIGFPKEDFDKVTEAFYMVDKSRSRSEGGAGLGLSLALLILDIHGGKLSIDSELNVGTTMSIILPIKEVNYEK